MVAPVWLMALERFAGTQVIVQDAGIPASNLFVFHSRFVAPVNLLLCFEDHGAIIFDLNVASLCWIYDSLKLEMCCRKSESVPSSFKHSKYIQKSRQLCVVQIDTGMQLHLNSNFYVFKLNICFSIQISSNTTSCPNGAYVQGGFGTVFAAIFTDSKNLNATHWRCNTSGTALVTTCLL